jgi:hypothetical protein
VLLLKKGVAIKEGVLLLKEVWLLKRGVAIKEGV